MQDKIVNFSFYTALLIICGLGEYYHLLPMGSLSLVVGGVLGHGISTTSTQMGNTLSNGNGDKKL